MASDYGFKIWNSGSGTEGMVRSFSMHQRLVSPADTDWAATFDFNDLAKNHCAATTITNYALWYLREYLGRQDADGTNASVIKQIFTDVHRYIPNGPVLRLKNRAARFFRAAKLPIEVVSIKEEAIQDELDAGNPVAIMVAASVMQWHWVLVVGYIFSEDGTRSYLIEDNWHRRGLYTYRPGIGSRLLDVLAFHVDREGAAV